MITEHHIKVERTARYCILAPTEKPKAILFAIHGYRQLAPFFIKQFQILANQGVLVIAPEGLHRFYVEGYSGRVGASWMTKEDRESDIEDYVAYLNTLYTSLLSEIENIPVHLLGFSQGGPTACRWLAGSAIPFQSLILYATVFPNDFDFTVNRERLNQLSVQIAFGDKDMFASEETISEKMEWLTSKGISPCLQRFEGGHEIKYEVLQRVWREVIGL